MEGDVGGGLRPAVKDVMTRQVRTVTPTAGFREMVALIEAARVSALPVVSESGAVEGIVSEADLLLKEEPERDRHRFESRARRRERAKAAGTTAAEVMTRPVIAAWPDMPVSEAARLMRAKGVKRLPVLDADGRLVGIVSRSDLLRIFLHDDESVRRQLRQDPVLRRLWTDPDDVVIESATAWSDCRARWSGGA
jgi:CBS domain-containing protein